MSEINDFFITALIMPMDDNLEKEKERGVKCIGFGRIESWAISGYDEGSPVVWISTETADYECVKPASSYKIFYDHFFEKARVCIEIYRKLARSTGGNPDMSLEELLAGVVRSMSGHKSSSGSISKDFIISLGEFIYNQLIGLDETSGNNDVPLATMPALLALRDECRNRIDFNKFNPSVSNGSLKIKDGEKEETIEDEDAKLARLLQEEEEWKLMKQQRSRRGSNSQKNVYIKISEAEIANDYPLPAYYKPSVEEMDEYIFDSDSIYPDLPRRWFCLETDLAQSGSSSSDQLDVGGVPVYLSSIKEWMIEFGSSMIFVSVRTDVAWYRLEKPTKQYAPWYEPVLKTARLAISIITLLKEQSRVSRLSFADVVKKVSEFDKGHPAYISSNLALVERYIVVHGQIILQQFAEYPDDTIRKSAFVTGLAVKMEERRHTKLLMKKKVLVQKGANLNPSASMGPILSKRKVMRATTTKLINRIWGDYYSNYFPEDSKEGGGNEAKEIEEEQEENEEDEVEEDEISVQEEKT
uniref:RFTS domain-containing protein n=1 Tax=Ananas comosus var. bracteatus TaxID=296719 RepID=A0A6V7QFG3_ANACO|nr:unnamed protein product [Ananas comosus var. bracteatus]